MLYSTGNMPEKNSSAGESVEPLGKRRVDRWLEWQVREWNYRHMVKHHSLFVPPDD